MFGGRFTADRTGESKPSPERAVLTLSNDPHGLRPGPHGPEPTLGEKIGIPAAFTTRSKDSHLTGNRFSLKWHPARRLVSITSGDHEVMGRIIKRDASRLKLNEVDEALGLFDGGPWIDAQMVRQQIPLTDKCLEIITSKTTSRRLASRSSETTKRAASGRMTSPNYSRH